MAKTIKPISKTSKPLHKFQIIIKDSYDAYSYIMKLPDTSPHDIIEVLSKHYKVSAPTGQWVGSGLKPLKAE